jgi:hypothetical protein
MVDRIPEMADDDPGKKNTGSAETHAAEFETAQQHPEDTDKGQSAYRVCNRLCAMKLEKPAHD